ncbi:quinone-dependent dihydroorotate dehydrogenase [Trichothermofontia sp.]
MNFYKAGLRPLLFSGFNVDPEWIHERLLHTLARLDSPHPTRLLRSAYTWAEQTWAVSDPRLSQSLWNLTFPNPLGLAAGFDKDGQAIGIWPRVGFGFAELGTVTFHAQPGNPQPRLFRLIEDEAVLNRMGFNNRGATALATRLQAYRERPSGIKRGVGVPPANHTETPDRDLVLPSNPIGVNLGKSQQTDLEDAIADYLGSFRLLQPWGDYFVVNVSSPNTPGLRSLQMADQLGPLLTALQQENTLGKPLLLKIAPDLSWDDITAILDLAQQHHLAGIIATNTTIARAGLRTQILPRTGHPITEEAGGISGAPLRARSTEIIRFIYRQTQGQLPIIGVGGIFTAADAWEKITAGASLVQVYTGLVYEGPGLIRRVLQGLLAQLDAHQLPTIAAAVGINA